VAGAAVVTTTGSGAVARPTAIPPPASTAAAAAAAAIRGAEPSPSVGGGLGPDLAQGAVQHQVTVRRPVQQGLRRHLAEQIGHGGQVLQVAPAGRAPRQVLLDGARALRVEEPQRQCAQLAGVVLVRFAYEELGCGEPGSPEACGPPSGGIAGGTVGPVMP
jgi:hypothetical protein